MYVGLDGHVRQAGRFRAKGAARERSQEVVDKLNRGGDDPALTPTLVDFLDEWSRRFPRHPRTEETNRERLERYILPHLPRGGHEQLGEVRRRTLLAVQDQLLRAGLSKTTIDGAFSALSALLRDAIELEYLDANPAHRLRVRPNDPRLSPLIEPAARRAVPPEEIHAFMTHVRPGYRAVCWTPVLTSARPAELFAMRRPDLDRRRQMIFVARNPHALRQEDGGAQADAPRRRPRAARALAALPRGPLRDARRAAPAPLRSAVSLAAGGRGACATSTATSGTRRGRSRGRASRSTTSATRFPRGCSRPASRWSRWPPGWVTACARVAPKSTTRPAGCTRTQRASGVRWRLQS
jgi:hypothetical protein